MGGLESARVIGVAHALRAEDHAYLALGRSQEQGDVLHVVPEFVEAGGVRQPPIHSICPDTSPFLELSNQPKKSPLLFTDIKNALVCCHVAQK